MSFTEVSDINNQIVSFLSPRDLITLERVSTSTASTTPYQWKKLKSYKH